jgi:DNA-binding MarR family transcriptional regulator
MADPAVLLRRWQAHAAASFAFAARVARARKLGLAEIAALEQVQTQGPLTPGALGTRLAMPSGTVTALVDRLAHKGLLVRETHPQAHALASGMMLETAAKIAGVAAKRTGAERAVIDAFLEEVTAMLLPGPN